MLFLIFSLFVSVAEASTASKRQTLSGSDVCANIASSVDGEVYYPLSTNYISGINHYFASASQQSTCVVEVTGPEDVSAVLKIVGSTRTPFGVKSGGHSANPGYSSTTGVQISLAKLTQVVLSEDKTTVEVGLGNVWLDVYNALNGTGVNVVGGRVPGPGTGGFSLGGGYSWLSNQFGLTCDTVSSYELVLPNGTITTVGSSNADLSFALKGGLNRFGVVTSITYNTVPQPDLVYGGIQIYGADAIPALLTATLEFQTQNTDPKAQLLTTLYGGVDAGIIMLFFYDGPERPAAFDPFINVTGAIASTVKVQSYANFISAVPSELMGGQRGAYHTLMTTSFTQNFLDAVYNESTYWGALALLNGGTTISYDIEPFLKYGQYATDSAFPHANSPLPLNVYYAWALQADDTFWEGVMQQSVDHLTEVAKVEGIYDCSPAYVNYALYTYSGTQVYGATNVARLRTIRDQYDPDQVMELAGGFSF